MHAVSPFSEDVGSFVKWVPGRNGDLQVVGTGRAALQVNRCLAEAHWIRQVPLETSNIDTAEFLFAVKGTEP